MWGKAVVVPSICIHSSAQKKEKMMKNKNTIKLLIFSTLGSMVIHKDIFAPPPIVATPTSVTHTTNSNAPINIGAVTTCPPCPTGAQTNANVYYANNGPSGCCLPCSSNQFSTAGSPCQPCPAGASSTQGSGSCTCPAGQFFNASNVTCNPCLAGSYCQQGATVATPCPAGTYSGSNATSCTPCGLGQVAAAGATACWTCTGFWMPSSDLSACICAEGYYYANASNASLYNSGVATNNCAPCPAGTYNNKTINATIGVNTCATCPSGTTSVAGSTSCR